MIENKNNTGLENTWHRNTWNYNTWNYNTWNRNTGLENTWHRNTWNYNTWNYNTWCYNTWDYNTWHSNTWHSNAWNYNTWNYNTWNRNTGLFNIDEPNARMFWKETNLKMSEFINSDAYPSFYEFNLTYWIPENEMTDEEKEENKTYKTTEWYLKSVDYKTAWKVFWRRTDKENKQKFLNLPNFDKNIFEEITWINVEEKPKEFTLDEIANSLWIDVKDLKIKK